MFSIDNCWQASADAWIADMGEHGDFGRRYVLDPIMLPRALTRSPKKALDISRSKLTIFIVRCGSKDTTHS
jgi:hypothetical protein